MQSSIKIIVRIRIMTCMSDEELQIRQELKKYIHN